MDQLMRTVKSKPVPSNRSAVWPDLRHCDLYIENIQCEEGIQSDMKQLLG